MFQTAQIVVPAVASGQDRVLVHRSDTTIVLAAADGVGGTSGGAEAAEMAISLIRRRAVSLNSQRDCKRLLVELDRAICADKVAGETTCVLVVVRPTGVFGASVGDSGAWVVGASGIDDLTHQQIRKPFLGVGTVASIGFTRAALTGTLIVASDGLLKYTSREKIATAVLEPDLDAVTSNLVGLVRYPSGALPDDVAIVLCRPSS